MTIDEARKFVVAWQTSSGIAEVVTKTGLSKEGVVATSRLLRKRGVPLKMYGKSTLPLSQLELDGLAELCE